MRQLGASVSESAVYRYNLRMQEVAKDIRLTREMAAAVGRELGEVPDGTGRMVVESLQTLLLRSRMQLSSTEKIDERQLLRLSSAARNLASAWKSHTDTEAKIRDRVLREAAKVAEKTAKEKGLTRETVDLIMRNILGIGQPDDLPSKFENETKPG